LIIVALTSEQFLADFGCSQAELVLGQDPSFLLWELAHPSMFLAEEPVGGVISLPVGNQFGVTKLLATCLQIFFFHCNHSAGLKALIK
jgi:hypothetical protein